MWPLLLLIGGGAVAVKAIAAAQSSAPSGASGITAAPSRANRAARRAPPGRSTGTPRPNAGVSVSPSRDVAQFPPRVRPDDQGYVGSAPARSSGTGIAAPPGPVPVAGPQPQPATAPGPLVPPTSMPVGALGTAPPQGSTSIAQTNISPMPMTADFRRRQAGDWGGNSSITDLQMDRTY